ncbi:MAG: AAA family ATPase [Pseudomonadales bacterium]|nr:AAA family ATPase [Pseudomonadales bacterium]
MNKVSAVVTELEKTVTARYPILYLASPEEERILALLNKVAINHGVDVIEWSCNDGFHVLNDQPFKDPVKAIQSIFDSDINGFYVFKDLEHSMGDPMLIRAMRDAYVRLRDHPLKKIIIVAPELKLPVALQHTTYVIDVPPPDQEELTELVISLLEMRGAKGVPQELIREIALAMTGLALNDCYHLLQALIAGGKLSRAKLLQKIQASKKNLTASADCLEYVAVERDLSDVAGFENFKRWMNDRATTFNQNAVSKGIPMPKGILIMGVSGCGKSLCAKAIPKVWNVPLFRLDMNLIFAGVDGSPQRSFHQALKTIESMAPVVLWIDEIENGLGTSDLSKPAQSQIFSAFLTWMQEKPPLVFVVATANRIEYLPAEMIRKGRFDQVFFVDLPNDAERKEMISLYIERNDAFPDDFDLKRLVSETKGWNGAEIEQLIENARIHALQQKRDFDTADIVEHALSIVPLSHTMSEQIKALKDWAWDRATPASVDNGMMLDLGSI